MKGEEMSEPYRPINYRHMIGAWIFAIMIFPITAIALEIFLPFSSSLLEATHMMVFQTVFNSALIISSILITIAPVTIRVFQDDVRDRESLRKYLKIYMVISVILLFVTVVLGMIVIANSLYHIGLLGSLFLLFSEIYGYMILCFPLRYKLRKETRRDRQRGSTAGLHKSKKA